jgi:hypothetical protein
MEMLTKDFYRKLVSDQSVDEGLKNSLIKFIDSYDGSNTKEFNEMMLRITGLLARLGVLEAKAEGYDRIKESQKSFNESLWELADTALTIKEFKTSRPTLEPKKK